MVGAFDGTYLSGVVNRRNDHAVLACDRLHRRVEAVVTCRVFTHRFVTVQLMQVGSRGDFEVDRLAVDRAFELGDDRGSGGCLARGLGVLVVAGVGDSEEGSSML